jgi:hypothetical protein
MDGSKPITDPTTLAGRAELARQLRSRAEWWESRGLEAWDVYRKSADALDAQAAEIQKLLDESKEDFVTNEKALQSRAAEMDSLRNGYRFRGEVIEKLEIRHDAQAAELEKLRAERREICNDVMGRDVEELPSIIRRVLAERMSFARERNEKSEEVERLRVDALQVQDQCITALESRIERLEAFLHMVEELKADRVSLRAELATARVEVERITSLWKFQVAENERLKAAETPPSVLGSKAYVPVERLHELQAEVERLQAEVAEWQRTARATTKLASELGAEIERITELWKFQIAESERLRFVMEHVASMAGKDWLAGQRTLVEALNPSPFGEPKPAESFESAGRLAETESVDSRAVVEEPRPAGPPPTSDRNVPFGAYPDSYLGPPPAHDRCPLCGWQWTDRKETKIGTIIEVERHCANPDCGVPCSAWAPPPPAPNHCPLCEGFYDPVLQDCDRCGLDRKFWPDVAELVKAKAAWDAMRSGAIDSVYRCGNDDKFFRAHHYGDNFKQAEQSESVDPVDAVLAAMAAEKGSA